MDYKIDLRPYGISVVYHHQSIDDIVGGGGGLEEQVRTASPSQAHEAQVDMADTFKRLQLLTLRADNAHHIIDGITAVEATSRLTAPGR